MRSGRRNAAIPSQLTVSHDDNTQSSFYLRAQCRVDRPDRRSAGRLRDATCFTREPSDSVADARTTLSNFIRDPDQTWIQENLSRARAVLIAPQIVRAGFIFGGSGGRAVLVARDGRTWTGPAFYNLATASVGFQAGVDVSEVVIVVMTEKG